MADAEIRPMAAKLDRKEQAPAEIVKRLGDLRLLGLTVPERYGGRGVDHLGHVLAVMEVSRACASAGAVMVVNNSLYCAFLTRFGSHEQNMTCLAPCTSGQKIGCYGLNERGWDYDPVGLETRAVRASGEWIIHGVKRFVPNGSLSSFCVLAAATEEGEGGNNISHFVLDLENTPGFRVNRIEETLGISAAGTAEIIFEHSKAPTNAILGVRGDGYRQMTTILATACIGVSAHTVGIGKAVLEETLEFANTGQRFGKPLSSSQTVQWKVADMVTEMSAAELLTLRAAWLLDHEKPFAKEASMARMYAAEVTMKSAVEGVQILGGYGCSKSYPMERHLRDAKMCQITMGPDVLMRRVVAEHLIRER